MDVECEHHLCGRYLFVPFVRMSHLPRLALEVEAVVKVQQVAKDVKADSPAKRLGQVKDLTLEHLRIH